MPDSDREPAEFRLVAACCIWPPSERRNQAIRAAIGEGLDWTRVVQITQRHRVAGLVHDGLSRATVTAPAEQAAHIAAIAAGVARDNLRLAAQSLAIQRACDKAGIAALFVKGSALAVLAYGGLGLKHSWDIDLVVTPQQLRAAIGVLDALGYDPSPPIASMDDNHWKRWVDFGREYIFRHRENGTVVELHWKLLEHPAFLPGVTAASPSHVVAITANASLRTLRDDDLFAYLCVHGAIHGWARIKWLADVAALVSGDSTDDLRRRLAAARAGHAEHCVAQAYLLCDRLFGTPALAAIARELRRRPRYRLLEAIALQAVTSDEMPGEGAFSELPLSISHFLLGRGMGHAPRELWNKLNRPYDLLYQDGEPAFLYPVLRVMRWLARRGRMRPLQ